MKLITVSGPPSTGKTSVIIKTIEHLSQKEIKVGVIKFDCLSTNDDILYKRKRIPVQVGISSGLCPDHQSFGDLLSKDYYKNISIRGRDEFVCETVLLNFYKEYGFEGIRLLSDNVKEGLHPAEMVKKATSTNHQDPVIYVMPYFFAGNISARKNIEFIWPEDGALVNAISMLVKKDISKDVKDLVEYIAGQEVGRVFTNAAFPVSNSAVDLGVFKDKGYKWFGWEFIQKNNLRKVMDEITDYYMSF